MQEINTSLDKFTSIGLVKLDTVKLLDRIDTKYVFERNKLSAILKVLMDYYYVLEVNGQRLSEYSSLYFDTPDFNLYHDHQTGRLSRFKIRYREYIKSGIKYFEIKYKNNKRRTIKYRVLQDNISSHISDSAEIFLREKTSYIPQKLAAKLWVNYSRITLMSKKEFERVTIDLNLSFRSVDSSKNFPNIVIAEVKQIKAGKSYFKYLMKLNKIRPASLSKYCLGIVNLYENVKKNNFKTKLKMITKLQNGVTANC
jgi:hypothetical protein